MQPVNENIVYYNAIANEYNDMVAKNADRIVREKVANKFCSIVKVSVVLDFGGGTGLDLEWLARNNHTIYFCEPSAGMRGKAIFSRKDLLNDNVIFLNDSVVDFRQWNLQLPFPVKVDAVLSNFAVLNCIPDIGLLFQNLALVVKPGGNMMALVLTRNLKKTFIANFGKILTSFIKGEPASIHIQYKENQQTVYLYSIKEIIKASRKYFDFCSSEVLPASGFTLIHLKRNERFI